MKTSKANGVFSSWNHPKRLILVSSSRFIWMSVLCYGSTAIIKIFNLTVQESTLDVRRQILTTDVDPRAARVKVLKYNLYINQETKFFFRF